MSPTDGNFNSSVEGVVATIDTSSLSLGRHLVFVQGQDANGNWGVVSAVFLDVTSMAAPAANFTSSSPDYLGQTTMFTNNSSEA